MDSGHGKGEHSQNCGRSLASPSSIRCRECKYLFACNGECPKNRLIRTPDGELGLDYLCSGLQEFWHHIDGDAQDICRRIAGGEPLRPLR
jgi:sulfatase maturation enzyme AslB (radical SAM superfamily)